MFSISELVSPPEAGMALIKMAWFGNQVAGAFEFSQGSVGRDAFFQDPFSFQFARRREERQVVVRLLWVEAHGRCEAKP